MQVVGIIAEYNPFHHGHEFQIAAVRRQYPGAHVIAVMSGSFTQRGGPCILDKWTRARHAVTGGVDLVLELPFVFVCRSAQDFARGGVSLLPQLGIVNHLAFGMEAETLEPLVRLAAQIDSDAVQERLCKHIGDGLSYAGALTRALIAETNTSEDMMRAPNNILAIEYLRALRVTAPNIAPLAIRRTAAQHGDVRLHTGITSASSIRRALGKSPRWQQLAQTVLPIVLDDLKEGHEQGLPQEDRLLELLRYQLLVMDAPALMKIYGISEGIEHRLIRSLETTADYRSFLAAAATKRCPQSRIARLIVHLLLHFRKTQARDFDAGGATYIRPLAFNLRGRELLRAIKRASTLPIITRTAAFLTSMERAGRTATHSPLQRMLAFDTRATELRSLMLPQGYTQNPRTDFITSPTFLR